MIVGYHQWNCTPHSSTIVPTRPISGTSTAPRLISASLRSAGERPKAILSFESGIVGVVLGFGKAAAVAARARDGSAWEACGMASKLPAATGGSGPCPRWAHQWEPDP